MFDFDVALAKEILEYMLTATSVIGYLYISKQNHVGFYWWMIGNFIGIGLFYLDHKWGLFGLYWFYTFINLYSIYEWKKKDKKKEEIDATTVVGNALPPKDDTIQ